jgi:uncharacterized protein
VRAPAGPPLDERRLCVRAQEGARERVVTRNRARSLRYDGRVHVTPVESAVLGEFCAKVRSRFGDRVRLIALYGSKARGDAHDASDVDVCVVIDDLTWPERREVNFMAGELLDEREVLLSPLAMSTEHMNLLRARELLIAAEIDTDGIPL